jgi:glucose/arabinose dehydrogenase
MKEILLILAASLLAADAIDAQSFSTVLYASGLDRPVFLTAPPGSIGRAFILDAHLGQIRILRLATRTLEPTPFLTIPGVSTGDEQGLLGLAFHPDYATNGYFYVNYTDPNTKIVRYQVSADPDVADPTSATPVLGFVQPQSNHNGGWIGFGPDGFLYIASGDGGGGNDSGTGHTTGTGNAQDTTDNLLGKVLRIDVDADAFPADPLRNYGIPPDNPFVGVSGDDEIWVYGLRNPWRASFDRLTDDLYIGDVGQNRCEELDVQPGTSTGGENYGWRLREGVIATPNVGGSPPAGAIDPIFDYPHAGTGEPCSDPGTGFTGVAITGGYVYRGPVAELDGRYFFADFATGELWSLRYDGSDPSSFDGTNYTELTDHTGDPDFTPDVGSIGSVASFGEDGIGNLYVVDLGGEVFYIPEPSGTLMQLAGAGMTWALSRHARRRNVQRTASAISSAPDAASDAEIAGTAVGRL